ncbi:hypothetical protein BD626DRAFT_480922 [Schizophyllum amplum]|uniref:Uncharacterized protein n=1 Tax=Schizophyllum amplum TaxID=97359 RepID=A0A550CTM9_9AGAR|nr:hypothetical protein BD626DRAFT_480922 [Auriculariopsis ampla]
MSARPRRATRTTLPRSDTPDEFQAAGRQHGHLSCAGRPRDVRCICQTPDGLSADTRSDGRKMKYMFLPCEPSRHYIDIEILQLYTAMGQCCDMDALRDLGRLCDDLWMPGSNEWIFPHFVLAYPIVCPFRCSADWSPWISVQRRPSIPTTMKWNASQRARQPSGC